MKKYQKVVNIHVFGAGDWAKEALHIFDDGDIYGNKINVLSFRDNDTKKQGDRIYNITINSMDTNKYPIINSEKIIAILTNIDAKKDAIIKCPQDIWWTYIHPSVCIRNEAQIGKGVFIAPNCHLAVGSVISDHCRLSYNVMVSENSKVGKYCIIQPGVFIGGETIIGDEVYIGAGAIIKDNIKVGSNSRVAIGAVVTKDIPSNVLVAGNPARIIRNNS